MSDHGIDVEITDQDRADLRRADFYARRLTDVLHGGVRRLIPEAHQGTWTLDSIRNRIKELTA